MQSRVAYVGLAVGIALLLSLGLLNLVLLNFGSGVVSSQALAHNSPPLQLEQSESSFLPSTLAITGTLLFTKTVGTDPNVCSTAGEIFVTSGTDVYFCYSVQNQTGNTLVYHTLSDGSLPQPNFGPDYILAPGQITTTIQGPVNITEEIVGSDGEAEWLATDDDETITATSLVEVFLTELEISASLFVGPKAVTTNIDECGSLDQLVIPSGMDVQYCLVIENQGNLPLTTVTVDSPGLGLDNVTLPNRQIAPGGRYQITFGELNRIRPAIGNIANRFAQFDITSSQTITVSVTGRTQENLAVTDTSSAMATVGNQVIDVTLDVRAGNRANACDDTAKSVSAGADVYYCVVVTNSGTLDIFNARISHTESSFGTVVLATLSPGQSYTQTQNALRIAVVHTDTVSFRGDVSTSLGSVVITKTAARGIQLIPVSNESLVPTPTLSPTSPTAGPTATNTRRPSLSTSTPFPSDTPTNTFTPSPHPVSPTNTPISPLPAPTPTSTPVILRAVASPVPAPTAIPTQTPTPTSSPTPTSTPTPADTSTSVSTPPPADTPTPADTPQTTDSNGTSATDSASSNDVDQNNENPNNENPNNDAPDPEAMQAEQTATAQNRQIASNAAKTTADQPESDQAASDQAGANQSTSPLPLPTATVDLEESALEENGETGREIDGESSGEAAISQTVSATVTSGSAQVPIPTGTLTSMVAPSTTSSVTDANLSTTHQVTTTASDNTTNNDVGRNEADGNSDLLASTDSPTNAIETSSSSPAFLMVTSVLEGALAAAAWLWFVCGSIIFFGVGGLIAGLYFRGQENSRFTLIRSRFGGQGSAQETAILATGASKADTDASGSQFQLKGKAPNPSRTSNRSSKPTATRGKASDDEHWPTSLP